MENYWSFFLVGSLLTAIIPMIHSIWRETRFTKKEHMMWGGALSIAFAIFYFGNNLPDDLTYLKSWSFAFFIPYGLLSILAGRKSRNNHEKAWTLIFSKRQFGAIGLAFLYPSLFGVLPSPIISIGLPAPWDFAAILLITVNLASLCVRIMRKYRINTNFLKIPRF